MHVENLVVRCYAQQSDGIWQAICIDLNLAAQADSLNEAKRKLEAQIVEYIYDAIAGEDRAIGVELLSRRAPLEFRIRYYLICAAQSLAGKVEFLSALLRNAMSFNETVPLVPAASR